MSFVISPRSNRLGSRGPNEKVLERELGCPVVTSAVYSGVEGSAEESKVSGVSNCKMVSRFT